MAGTVSGTRRFRSPVGDLLCGGLDAEEGTQAQSYGGVAEQGDADGDDHAQKRAEPQQLGGSAVDGVQGQGDHGPHAIGSGVGDGAPAAAAVEGLDGGGLIVAQAQLVGAGGEARPPVVGEAQGVVHQATVGEIGRAHV